MVWMRPEQARLVRAVAELANVRIVSVGTAEPGRAGPLAEQFGAQPVDDLRAAIARLGVVSGGSGGGAGNAGALGGTPTLVWLAAAADFGQPAGGGGALAPLSPLSPLSSRRSDDRGDEPRVLAAARERGIRIATAEPMPASLIEFAAGLALGAEVSAVAAGAALAGSARGEWARFVPLSRHSGVIRQSAEMLEQFGAARSASIQVLGGPVHGSLGARLFDAMDLAAVFLPEVEVIDAAFQPVQGVGGVAGSTAGESLRGSGPAEAGGLHGDMTLHLRCAGGVGATVVISDQAGAWERLVTLVGPSGRLRIYNDGLEWIDPAGVRKDASRRRPTVRRAADAPRDSLFKPEGAETELTVPGGAADCIAEQLKELMAAGHAGPGGTDYTRVLAMAQAALLSCRTGQGESPLTIRRMAGLV